MKCELCTATGPASGWYVRENPMPGHTGLIGWCPKHDPRFPGHPAWRKTPQLTIFGGAR